MAGCLAALTHQSPGAPSPSCSNQNCLQIVSNIPYEDGIKSSLVESHCCRLSLRFIGQVRTWVSCFQFFELNFPHWYKIFKKTYIFIGFCEGQILQIKCVIDNQSTLNGFQDCDVPTALLTEGYLDQLMWHLEARNQGFGSLFQCSLYINLNFPGWITQGLETGDRYT